MRKIYLLILAFLVVALSSCAASKAYREGNQLLKSGDSISGLGKLEEAMLKDPMNAEYRATYFRQKEGLINRILARAENKASLGALDDARIDFKKVLIIDSGNVRASRGLEQLDSAVKAERLADETTEYLQQKKFADALSSLSQAIALQPGNSRLMALKDEVEQHMGIKPKNAATELGAQFKKEISFSFRDAPISAVFDALVHATGINFIFDKDVRVDTHISMSIKQKPMQDVLRVVLSMNQLNHRVLDESTILIYPNTVAKADEYQELIIRNFYLSHSNVQQTANMLKAMVKAKDLFVDERLNLIVMKDTRDTINLAEQLIATQDLPEPEVMLELEVLEIASNKMRDLGIRWPDQISGSVTGSAGVRGELTYDEFRNPSKGLVTVQVNNPLITATLRQLDGDASLLANPRIRIKNRAKANILIGERVPVVTTTTTANVGTSESVNYLDVGLKLNLEPVISLDQQVSMNVNLEVSNILETITRTSGLQTYRLGTRNASTVLRVKDGETQILAGLIQQDERNSAQRVPFLGDFPLLGRLFSSTSENGVKTEIVLLITPRIIRNIPLPTSGKSEILSGTQNSLGAAPIQLRSLSASTSNSPETSAISQFGLNPEVQRSETIDSMSMPNSTQPGPPAVDQSIFIPPMPGVKP
ncbi:general secretion pathway protein GspD [Limnobacter humi]|uniref:General secretion pathway protein GspD n=1 Tax=Limnobacter humi TaxID=1778671 RepID=A0ABT1WDQ2_9BURK|nr:general secretion pathway protein GspD [Limnobacter humi]